MDAPATILGGLTFARKAVVMGQAGIMSWKRFITSGMMLTMLIHTAVDMEQLPMQTGMRAAPVSAIVAMVVWIARRFPWKTCYGVVVMG